MRFYAGMNVDSVHVITGIDPWFLASIEELVQIEGKLRLVRSLEEASNELIRLAKQNGFSDRQLATLWETTENEVRHDRHRRGIRAMFKLVDTCAAEFEAVTPYYYSTYEREDEARVGDCPRIVILGGGPNRIGQGIEFDYCCCQAAFSRQGRRIRGCDGELQPRDCEYRLRHFRPPVFRAAHS